MRNVLAAVLAVVFVGALCVWFFLLRDTPAATSPTPAPPAQGPAASAGKPNDTAAATQAAEVADVPAVSLDAVNADEVDMSEAITIQFFGVVQAGSSGAPIAGATIRLATTFSDEFQQAEDLPEGLKSALGGQYAATTDADGAYRLELKDVVAELLPMSSITCEAPGYARSHVNFDYAEKLGDGMEKRQDFFLKGGSKVFGRVTRADTGAAVEGARIIAAKTNLDPFGRFDSELEPPLAATSGEDGTYSLNGLEEATYTLIAATPDNALTIPLKARPRIKAMPGTDTEKDLALSPAAAVQGTVRFPAGAAHSEYTIVSASRNSNMSEALGGNLQEMMYDSFAPKSSGLEDDNTYRIAGLEFGVEYTVSIEAEGFAEAKSAPFSIADGQSPVTVDLVVTRGSTLRGKALYEDGTPASGVDLVITRGFKTLFEGDFDHFQSHCETKEDGTFEIPNVPAGEYKVVAQKDMYQAFNPLTADAKADDDEMVAVDGVNDLSGLVVNVKGAAKAPGNGVITGTLLDQGGKPVAGERVDAFAFEDGESDRSEATTADDGTFKFEKLSGEEYTITCMRGKEVAKAKGVAPGGDITLQFAPEAVISGTVINAAGDPVDGCTVQLKFQKEAAAGVAGMFDPDQMMNMMDMRSNTARTDTFGLFEIKDFKPGRYVVQVMASSAGYGESEAFTVADGESKGGLQIQLAKGVTFSGRVLEMGGTPIAGANVTLMESAADNPMFAQVMDMMPEMLQQGSEGVQTDDTGKFTMQNLAPGDYKLSAKAEGYAAASESVSLIAGQDPPEHLVYLARGGCIAGTAMVKGTAKAGLMVQAISGGAMKQAISGEGGRFEICGLNAGTYMVSVMDMSGMMSGDLSGFVPTMRKAEVREGETTEVDFGPQEGTVSVRGTVHGERGKFTTVSLKKDGAPEPNMADAFNMDAAMEALEFMGGNAMTDENGAFVIDEVSPGDYILEVHTVTLDLANLDLAEAMADNMKPAIRQNITVPPGTGLTLELELPQAE